MESKRSAASLDPQQERGRNRSVSLLFKNVSWVFVSQCVRAVKALIRSVIFARILGVEQYASLALFVAAASTVVELFNFHFGASVIKFGSEFQANHRPGELLSIVKYGYVGTLTFLTLACVVTTGVVVAWGELVVDLWLVIAVAGAYSCQHLDGMNKAVLRFFDSFSVASLADAITSCFTIAFLLLVMAFAGWTIEQCVAIWAGTVLLPTIVSCSLTVGVLRREVPGWLRAPFGPIANSGRRIVMFLLSSSLITSLQQVVLRGDILLLSVSMGDAPEVAKTISVYDVCKKLASSLSLARSVMAIAVFPQITKEIQSRSYELASWLPRFAIFVGLPISVAGGGIAVLVGEQLVTTIYSAEYSGGRLILGGLVVSALLQVMFFWGSSLVYATDRHAPYLIVVLLSGGLCAALVLTVSPAIGGLAGALGSIVYSACNGVFFLVCVGQLRPQGPLPDVADRHGVNA